jgi:hypothetical protein
MEKIGKHFISPLPLYNSLIKIYTALPFSGELLGITTGSAEI